MRPLFFVMLALASGKTYAIQGIVRSDKTREPVGNAIVVLQCACLESARETVTSPQGLYHFGGLGPGTYTIEVLIGEADLSKVVTLPP